MLPKDTQRGVIHLVPILVIVLLTIGLVIGVQEIQKRKVFAPKALTPRADEVPETNVDGEQKPTFVPGEVIVKLKLTAPQEGRLKSKSVEDNLDEEAVGIQSLEDASVPQVLKNLNERHKIQRIEKLFKGAQKPAQEIPKVKARFLQEIVEGKRTINEEELKKVDLSRIYKVSLPQDAPIEQIAQDLSQNSEVEYAHPNFIAKAQAVPNDPYYEQMWNLKKVRMEQAWDTSKGSNEMKVAVLDTGIDYTHEDLGATQIQERAFERITGEPAVPAYPFLRDFDQVFHLNNDRIVYPYEHSIYLYNLQTKTLDTISLHAPDLWVSRLALFDKYLVYYGVAYDDSTKPAIYLYNLSTKEHRKVVETDVLVGQFSYTNDKLIYNRSDIYMYDILSGAEQLVPRKTFDIGYTSRYDAFASGDLIVFQLNTSDTCNGQPVLYSITTGEAKKFSPPFIGRILSLNGSKLLYVGCNYWNFDSLWSTYYLYDIHTGEYQVLNYYTAPAQGSPVITDLDRVGKEGLGSISSTISKGAIGNDVIFFSKNIDATRIIMFDRNSRRYIPLNLVKKSYAISTEGNRICFMSEDLHIYCHMYSPSNDYSVPIQVFNQRVASGFDFIEQDNDPFDENDHGTHVAGTIGAVVNNARGTAGVSWNVQLMAVRVLDAYGDGRTTQILSGIKYAADNGARVLNLSLSGDYPCSSAPSWQEAIVYARSLGAVVVVAAGNDNNDASGASPASCNGVITVGATGPNDSRSYYSNYGTTVDVAAPGGDAFICSGAAACLIRSTISDNRYELYQGTSMAAPHISGVVALMIAKNPQLSPDEIENILKSPGETISTDKPIGKRLNAYRAVQAVPIFIPTPTPISTPSPSPSPSPITIRKDLMVSFALKGRREGVGLGLSEPFRLKIWKIVNGTQPAETIIDHDFITDAKGMTTIPITVQPDTGYSVRLKARHSVPIEKPFVIFDTSPTATLSFGIIPNANANTDDVINILDFSLLASSFGKLTGQPGFNPDTDFNGDGKVTILDFSLLASDFGKSTIILK